LRLSPAPQGRHALLHAEFHARAKRVCQGTASSRRGRTAVPGRAPFARTSYQPEISRTDIKCLLLSSCASSWKKKIPNSGKAL
jgi:hypothetical protein